MALKVTLANKGELDQLPEAVRPLYAERDGKFVLDVEGGLVPKTEHDELKVKLAEFRDNNRTMFDELKVLKPIGEAFKKKNITDVDAFLSEHDTLKTTVDDLKKKGVGNTNDLDAAINNAMKPVLQRLDEAENARKTAQQAADRAMFERLVTTEAQKAGVRPNSLRFVLTEAEKKFELKEGGLSPRSGIRNTADPLKELTPADWLQELSTTDDYLFGDSVGTGAQNRNENRRDVKVVKELINPSPEEMGMNMAGIAKGEIKVVRTVTR